VADPLEERKCRLQELIPSSGPIRFPTRSTLHQMTLPPLPLRIGLNGLLQNAPDRLTNPGNGPALGQSSKHINSLNS
jgi:hypothetical protein